MATVKFHEVGISSFVYEAGTTEDGERFIAEAYEIQITKPNGARFVHPMKFAGTLPETNEEGYQVFPDVRADALRKALRLRRRIRRAGQFDQNIWLEGRPVYGSPAYCSEDEIALEKREAEEESWKI